MKTLIGCISSAAMALSSGACGKDKSEPEAVAEGEAPLEGTADKGESKPDEDASKPSTEADATPERPHRPLRDKTGRRPPPVKHGGADAAGHGETRPGEPSHQPGSPGMPVAAAVDGSNAQNGANGPSGPAGMNGPNGPTPEPRPEPGQASPTDTPSPGGLPTIVSGGIPGIPAPEPAGPSPVPPANPAPTPAEPAPDAPSGESHLANRDAETLLPLSVILEQLGAVRLNALGALPGIAIRPGYSSVLYGRPDGSKFGLSLQVWQDPSRNDSEERYRRMRMQYPNGEEVSVLTPAKAFYSQFGGVQTLTFVDSVTRTVVSVACGEGLCSHEQLTKLARAVRARF